MGFYDAEENVDLYLGMIEGYDGAPMIATFAANVPAGAKVLELGMGGGGDVDRLLDAGFDVTGSDASQVFLDKYAARGGKAPTLKLDATTLETDRRFDVIFSNKVLHHLTRPELSASLARQAELLNPDGRLFHAFWFGEGEEEHHGMLFTKYTEETLAATLPDGLQVTAQARYAEDADDDSLWVVLQPPPSSSKPASSTLSD